MCLDMITKEFEDKEGEGYKVLYRYTLRTINQASILRKRVWNKAKQVKISCWNGTLYMTGFHILTSLKSAREWKRKYGGRIVKVKYRKGRILGKQEDMNIIVADEMKLLEEI